MAAGTWEGRSSGAASPSDAGCRCICIAAVLHERNPAYRDHRPVIATDHAAVPEYVFDDENGYLI